MREWVTTVGQMVAASVADYRWLWLAIVLLLPPCYYGLQLLGLILRFGDLPNYMHEYDWFNSVKVIVESTPSWRDALMITLDEWLLEVGYMNYDFGNGISEWSLVLAPAHMVGHLLFSALIATNYVVLLARRGSCGRRVMVSGSVFNGLGAALVALSSISMSWVVCCATPTWVVGLSMMGLGVTTSLWLEPAGVWIKSLGFIAMLMVLILVAGGSRSSQKRTQESVSTSNPETMR